jgi:sortase A
MRKLLITIFIGLMIGLAVGGVGGYFLFWDNPNFETNITDDISDTTAAEVDQNGLYLSIDKLNLSAPIITGVDPSDEKRYNEALKTGVLLMPGMSLPGEGGHIFIYGHSSSNVQSDYDKIFANLNDLNSDDQIKIHYQGEEYIYKVAEKKIIAPTDTSVLAKTTSETLTLMTCWPVGTDDQRLVVIANKI